MANPDPSKQAFGATAQKKALRACYKAIPTTDYPNEADYFILENLLRLPAYEAAGTVFCFVSMPGEPETRDFLKQALEDGKRVGVPLCTGPGEMVIKEIHDVAQALNARGAFGIPEPAADMPTIPPEEVDLAVVPSVACDLDGYRLGHGGGYYDRFLAACPGYKVLIQFKSHVADRLPREAHDQRCDALITERGLQELRDPEAGQDA